MTFCCKISASTLMRRLSPAYRSFVVGSSSNVIDEIKRLCDEHQVEFELISKLIIEIEANKNYTNNSMVTKAFDRIINQGWLHFDSIEKGLQNENQ